MSFLPEQTRDHRAIAVWLLICAGLVFAMVVLGGVTRLTHSGLSMVEWRPVTGFLPPLGQEEWQQAFSRYKEFPEYQKVNQGMTLDGFKAIFWFEYSHRVLGRLIGIAFFVPFVFFVARRRVGRRLFPTLLLMFVLGGLQGVLGWYMVKSGLVDRPDVSHLRLTAHLGAALVIYGFILWVAFGLLGSGSSTEDPIANRLRPTLKITCVAILIVALSGGLVAGLDAGFHYNTFPKMGDTWVPSGLGALQPWWSNFLDNRTTVQFDHRLLAESLFFAVIGVYLWARRLGISGRAHRALLVLVGAVTLQAALGITTLLLVIPVSLAAIHQAGALVALASAVWAARELSPQLKGSDFRALR
jgi:heme a synthase